MQFEYGRLLSLLLPCSGAKKEKVKDTCAFIRGILTNGQDTLFKMR